MTATVSSDCTDFLPTEMGETLRRAGDVVEIFAYGKKRTMTRRSETSDLIYTIKIMLYLYNLNHFLIELYLLTKEF